ncbi:MAG: septum formation initiator family protein [Actinomycetota bacterium]
MTTAAPRRRWGARGAIAALVIVGLLFTSFYPLRRYFAVRRQVTALRVESASLDQEAAQLRVQAQTLQTDTEVERLARERLGFVGRGETAFSIPHATVAPEPTPTVILAPGQQVPRAGDGLVSRWWQAFRHAWGFH